jgi:hypothetical protein
MNVTVSGSYRVIQELAVCRSYRVIQEESSIFRQMTFIGHCQTIVRVDMCLVLNVYQDRAVWIYSDECVVSGNEEIDITFR